MLQAKRTCGPCTACCKALELITPELVKPAGKWCPHCEIGKRCKIYVDRPSDCQGFVCEWLKGFGEERDRPDRLHVVLDHAVDPEGEALGLTGGTFQIWEVTEGALESSRVQQITEQKVRQGFYVLHIPLGARRYGKLFSLRSADIVVESVRVAVTDGKTIDALASPRGLLFSR